MRYRISLFYNLNMSKTAAKVCAEKYKKKYSIMAQKPIEKKTKKE